MQLRDAIDKTAGNPATEKLITPDDMRVLDDYTTTMCGQLGVSTSGPERARLRAALALMYRAGVVAGRGA